MREGKPLSLRATLTTITTCVCRFAILAHESPPSCATSYAQSQILEVPCNLQFLRMTPLRATFWSRLILYKTLKKIHKTLAVFSATCVKGRVKRAPSVGNSYHSPSLNKTDIYIRKKCVHCYTQQTYPMHATSSASHQTYLQTATSQ